MESPDRTSPETVNPQPPDLADLVLPDLPLLPQLGWRDTRLRRSPVLQGLVERAKHSRVLEELEHARLSLVSQTCLLPDYSKGIFEKCGFCCRFRHVGLVPRVSHFGAFGLFKVLFVCGHVVAGREVFILMGDGISIDK